MTSEDPKPESHGPIQRLAASFMGLLQCHLGMFSIEVEEARERMITTLVLVIVGSGSILLCLLTLTLATILMVGEAWRLQAVMALLVVFVLLGAGCLWAAWQGMKRGPQLFEATIEEIRRDKERLLP